VRAISRTVATLQLPRIGRHRVSRQARAASGNAPAASPPAAGSAGAGRERALDRLGVHAADRELAPREHFSRWGRRQGHTPAIGKLFGVDPRIARPGFGPGLEMRQLDPQHRGLDGIEARARPRFDVQPVALSV
jgi:hypothetical protein